MVGICFRVLRSISAYITTSQATCHSEEGRFSFLSNVITILEQTSNEIVPECMSRQAFDPMSNRSAQFFGCNGGSAGLHGGSQGLSVFGQAPRFRLDGVQVYPNWLLRDESPARISPFLKAVTDYHLLYRTVKGILCWREKVRG